MNRPSPATNPYEPDPVLPACRATAERLQAVLDGDTAVEAITADPHVTACRVCRERVAAARLLLTVLAQPVSSAPASTELATIVVSGLRADRRARGRRRVYAVVGGFAVAAAVLVAVWVWSNRSQTRPNDPPVEVVDQTPTPPSVPQPAPPGEPKPLRVNDELAKAGQAFENSTRPITEPAEAAPKMIVAIADGLLKPGNDPGPDLDPARKSLAEIPAAAKTGLEPVADTAQKAFSRMLRDVGAIQPGPKPKS